MTNYDRKKLTEVVLFILNETDGLDFYHVFKILYFAEAKHLADWGCGIVADEFRALRYGPVPMGLYSAIKELNNPGEALAEELAEAVMFAGEDAPNVLLAKRTANTDYLSKTERETLHQSILENKTLTFGQLVHKSHDCAWIAADGGTITSTNMAKAQHASPEMLGYIEEQNQLTAALAK